MAGIITQGRGNENISNNEGKNWPTDMQAVTRMYIEGWKRGRHMRTSTNEYDKNGRLINGYDYDNQAWVIDGKYVRCGHPESMKCGCYSRKHAGEKTI